MLAGLEDSELFFCRLDATEDIPELGFIFLVARVLLVDFLVEEFCLCDLDAMLHSGGFPDEKSIPDNFSSSTPAVVVSTPFDDGCTGDSDPELF